jgi:hypothetical protein
MASVTGHEVVHCNAGAIAKQVTSEVVTVV